MALDGLGAFNKADDSVNVLVASYGGLQNVDTGAGYGAKVTAGNKSEFEVFLNHLFHVNGNDDNLSFDGTSWSVVTNLTKSPIARYIKRFQTRLYLAYIKIAETTYPSRVWYSDLPKNDSLEWGIETSSDLVQTADSAIVTSTTASFKSRGIKMGDPFFITSGANVGEYSVASIDSETQITLTDNLSNTVSGSNYWVGGNWFDVNTDDNDVIRGLGKNSNRLLVFKLMSLHRWDLDTLRPVKGIVGTSSQRSVVNIGEYTLYFHGSFGNLTGIYIYDGRSGQLVTRGIQPYIEGINTSMFPDIVAWREGYLYRCYVGDISNTQRNISVDKAVITYDVKGNNISVDPIAHVPKCVAYFKENNQEKVFFGDDNNSVFLTPDGWNFGSSDNPIPWAMETRDIYPSGSEFVNTFTRLQVIGRDLRGIRVRYKLINTPWESDKEWQGLGELSGERTELTIPTNHSEACGIKIRFEEIGIREVAHLIEKISLFYVPLGRTK